LPILHHGLTRPSCLKTLCDHLEPVASIFVPVIGKYALFIKTPRDLIALTQEMLGHQHKL